MRKLMMVSVLALVLVPLLATVALAEGQLIQCRNVLPCDGRHRRRQDPRAYR